MLDVIQDMNAKMKDLKSLISSMTKDEKQLYDDTNEAFQKIATSIETPTPARIADLQGALDTFKELLQS